MIAYDLVFDQTNALDCIRKRNLFIRNSVTVVYLMSRDHMNQKPCLGLTGGLTQVKCMTQRH